MEKKLKNHCSTPITFSRKYAYADDLAITHADGDCMVSGGRGTQQ